MSDNVPVPDLASIVAPNHVTGSVAGNHTAQVVAPATTAELSEVLRACNADRLTVVPTGGGTKLGWGNPVQADILLSTERLSGVHEHAWADLTATAGAGTRWAELQSVLAKDAQHAQRVALDPLFASGGASGGASGVTGRATVGGVLATNDSGPLRARYGSLRDLVIGMTIVLADGTIARTGGKVVKNVAGYDLPKLLTGSFGTLGIITEATFRLHPLPLAQTSFTLRSPDALALGNLMKRLYAAHLSIERCQIRNEPTNFALDIELASIPEALEEQKTRLRELGAAFSPEPASEATWQTREALFADPNATILKVTSLPARLPALVASFAQLVQMPGVSAQCVAEPSGIATCSLAFNDAQAPQADQPMPQFSFVIENLIEDLRSRLRTHGGSAVVLQRGHLPLTVDTWGGVPSAIDVMRAVKAEFDPTRSLSPGRFVGGI